MKPDFIRTFSLFVSLSLIPALAISRQLEIFWSEGFSNGIAGENNNGAWTISGEQGELWFQTFPIGSQNGYNILEAVNEGTNPLYGTKIPNYFNPNQFDVCFSSTRDNGVMMLDADRWNSTSTVEEPNGSLTTFPIESSLISPSMDLTGAEYAMLKFYMSSAGCCINTSYLVDFSTDSGNTWTSTELIWDYIHPKDHNDLEISINISSELQSVDNLTNCKVRFRWGAEESHTHYYWMIDDVRVEAIAENDLVAGNTYYNNYYQKYIPFSSGEISAEEYYGSLEYVNQPAYLANPFNFSMIVENIGYSTQTNVILELIITMEESGEQVIGYSEPIQIEPFTSDTLRISGSPMEEFNGLYGEYTFKYRVTQDQDDFNPENNIGASKATSLSDETIQNVFSTLQNDGGPSNYDEVRPAPFGSNAIYGNVYNYELPPFYVNYFITAIETVFLYKDSVAETQVGQPIYFNIRKGSVFEEDVEDPSTLTEVYFDSENPYSYTTQGIENIEYIIQQEDLWIPNPNDSITPFVWTTLELPEPIHMYNYLNDGIIQAEIRFIPSETPYVFLPISSNQESFSTMVYNGQSDSWLYFSDGGSVPIRLKIALGLSIDEITTSENGITLTQNYPNPFNDVTTIQYQVSRSEPMTFELHDIFGKLVFSEVIGSISPDVPHTYELNRKNLAAGVYTYSLISEKSRVTRKLMIK